MSIIQSGTRPSLPPPMQLAMLVCETFTRPGLAGEGVAA